MGRHRADSLDPVQGHRAAEFDSPVPVTDPLLLDAVEREMRRRRAAREAPRVTAERGRSAATVTAREQARSTAPAADRHRGREVEPPAAPRPALTGVVIPMTYGEDLQPVLAAAPTQDAGAPSPPPIAVAPTPEPADAALVEHKAATDQGGIAGSDGDEQRQRRMRFPSSDLLGSVTGSVALWGGVGLVLTTALTISALLRI